MEGFGSQSDDPISRQGSAFLLLFPGFIQCAVFDHWPSNELVVTAQQCLSLVEQGHSFMLGTDCAENAALDTLRMALKQVGNAPAAVVVADVVGQNPMSVIGGVFGCCRVIAAQWGGHGVA